MRHVPVLAEEIYQNLPDKLDKFLDWTVWHAWHCQYLISKLDNNKAFFVGVDRDQSMLSKADEYLSWYSWRYKLLNLSYSQLDEIVNESWFDTFDWILLDLWVNMDHFKLFDRWFSIKWEGKLDMRFDSNSNFTAYDLINTYSRSKLSEIFKKYWDFSDKFAEFIADTIISERKKQKHIYSTSQLVDLIKSVWLWNKKISVIFQCIRIEVNNELWHLEIFLDNFEKYISKWWKCYIITYHSIEDRIVKYKFKDLAASDNFELVNKKVIKPHYKEVLSNKASRSAKLRIIKAL